MRVLSGSDGDGSDCASRKTVVLTLDLECDYGTALRENTYEAAAKTPKLRSLVEEYDVPLTCFLQTELFEAVPEAVETLEQASVPVDFHAHSHTHPHPKRADFEYEIAESLDRVANRFSSDVVGYRFPDGAIPTDGYQLLEERDVDFSSSLFPTWRPGRFNNSNQPITPHEPVPGLLELPITPFSSAVRIPVSVSYLKFLGRPYRELVSRRPPNVIVFDIHMHDLVTPSTIGSLPLPYRLVYNRNREQGFPILRRFIEDLRQRGYRFTTMTDLYTEFDEAATNFTPSSTGK